MPSPRANSPGWMPLLCLAVLMSCLRAGAIPAHRAALDRHYDRFLAHPLAACTTCHKPSSIQAPESLDEFPHNPFGNRLRELGRDRNAAGEKPDLITRLKRIAAEDSDGDGVPNEAELLLGHNPGNASDTPTRQELATLSARQSEFAKFLASYRWQPFAPVVRPAVPSADSGTAARNPIDLFLAAEWQRRGLTPRPEASREVLLRRVYVDLIGLNPSPEELHAFLADSSPDAYERVVNRLLDDPRYGERWGRHWMDVWRYSDWAGWADGGQVRDSKPHIWRWRDWIVESLNADKPYDQMIREMLAADELAPADPDALRATGFLVRNYKMLSREQWLEDTVKHTAQAFLGVTMGCAKCHDHMVDPISQREYYAFRAIFEPHQVRTDRLPGQLDTAKDGLPRAFDSTNAPTYFLVRGDERHPRTNDILSPGVPAAFGGRLEIQPVNLPASASQPDRRPFVIRDTLSASEQSVTTARSELERLRADAKSTRAQRTEAQLGLDIAEIKHAALRSILKAEAGDSGAATNAVRFQRALAVFEAELKSHQARIKLDTAATNAVAEARKNSTEADQQLAAAREAAAKPLTAAYTPRPAETFPATSTGRRTALAQWLTQTRNPLTARVAVNHVWLRHFGRGLVPTPADFGRNGRPPSHPELLDWLAAEFMQPSAATSTATATASGSGTASQQAWSFKTLHRLMLTSAAYRRAATPDAADLAADPDNLYLWRMNARRLEAEAVRDTLLQVAGGLDLVRGGPDIDQKLALTSPRRSLYLRHAAEKQSEFLQIFDGPSVTECYVRRPSVIPQQALALGNSELAITLSRKLGTQLVEESRGDASILVNRAFERILARRPTAAELQSCLEAFTPAAVSESIARTHLQHDAENLVLVLFNHNDFITVR